MSSPSEEVQGTISPHPGSKQIGKSRTVVACNFRTSGRLSNEDARLLTAIHETLAEQLASALDSYLGMGLEIKLQTLDRISVKDYMASLSVPCYILPFSLSDPACSVILEWDMQLIFPILELLMGGSGGSKSGDRELSEIDDEILHDIFVLVARLAESAWKLPELSLASNRRIKPVLLDQYCPADEKATVVRFEIELGGATGFFQFAFSSTFFNFLMKQIQKDQPQKKGKIRFFPTPNMRERVLDCDMEVSTELCGLKVAVRDLVTLQPGSVLKLRAPIQTPAMLTAGGRGLFEAVPVRHGLQRAAQLGRRAQTADWKRG